jgi:hypothetical protein
LKRGLIFACSAAERISDSGFFTRGKASGFAKAQPILRAADEVIE